MTNHQITTLQKDIETATSAQQIDVSHVLNSLYPRALEALNSVDTVEDVNIIRHGLEAIVTATNRHIPKYVKDRAIRLRKANKGNDIYLQACRRTGEFWNIADKYQGRPPTKSLKDVRLLTALEVGFTSSHDAMRCVKASKVNEQDYHIYKDECSLNGRQYTLSGLVNVYDLLNPKDRPTPSLFKRSKIVQADLVGLVDDSNGDLQKLFQKALDEIEDAIEILKDDQEA